MSPPCVLLTRPAPEAAQWAQALRARGLAAEALPLIEIVPEALAGALHAARERLGEYHAAMFVSGNAVRGFHQEKTPETTIQGAQAAIKTRAWSPGPGTTEALLQAGWPRSRIDAPAADAAQFDSEALWAAVAPQARPGARVLIVRGGDAAGRIAGRDWLARQLAAAGVAVDQVVAYRRSAAVLDAARQARARAAAVDGSLWLFSSAEAIAHLRAALPGVDWSAARALATHPRIAEAARAAGFGAVHPTQPALDAVVASVKSLS